MSLQDWLLIAAIVVLAGTAIASMRRGDRLEAGAGIVALALIALFLVVVCVGLESDVARERFWVRHLWAERDSAYRENQALRETLLLGRTAR